MNEEIHAEIEEKLILISNTDTYRLVKPSEILYLRSENCYTRIYLKDSSVYLVCKTLKEYRLNLNCRQFIHCHRSFLVNVSYIKEIVCQKLDYIILTSGIKIPVSRRKLNETKKSIKLITVYLTKTTVYLK